MAIVSFNNLASVGLVKDVDSRNLPCSDKDGFAWSDVLNMRFKNGAIQKINGYSTLLQTTLPISPTYNTRIVNSGTSYYFFGGTSKIYLQSASTNTDVSGSTYTATDDNRWNSCVINSLPVFNNGINPPQASSSIGTTLGNLLGWGSVTSTSMDAASTTAKVVRSYLGFLIALNVTAKFSGSTISTNQNLVWWSDLALPGKLPQSWDVANATTVSGWQALADSDGYLVDCMPLGANNIIYKNTSTYIMSYVGANSSSPFSITKVFPSVGMLTTNCVATWNNQHFVVTTDDVIMHNGYQYQSIIDQKNRVFLFNDMHKTLYNRTYVVPNYANNEIWICYPNTLASSYANSVLAYNYINNTWSKYSLPAEASNISEGFIDIPTTYAWNNSSIAGQPWTNSTFNSPWINSKNNTTSWTLTGCMPSLSANNIFVFYKTDSTNQKSYVERTNISLDPDQNIKLIKRIWPRITETGTGSNTTISVNIGTSMTYNGDITWTNIPFNIVSDTKVDCLVSGRYLSIHFESNTDVGWSIDGFDAEVIDKGRF